MKRLAIALLLATVGCSSPSSPTSGAATSKKPTTASASTPAATVDVAAQARYVSRMGPLPGEIISGNALLQGCTGRLTSACLQYAATLTADTRRLLRRLAASGSGQPGALEGLLTATRQAAQSVVSAEQELQGLGCKPGDGGTLCGGQFGGLQAHADQLAQALQQWAAFATQTPAPIAQAKYTPPPPKPLHYSGTGDDVIRVHVPGRGPGILTAVYTGSDNFIVDAHGYGSELAGGEGLINTIGAYQGTTPLDFGDGTTTSLQVQSSGPWQFTIADAREAPSFTSSDRGHGDAVLIYRGSSSILHLTNSGQDNFIVDEYGSSSGDNNLVNEIGSYSGTVEGEGGPAFIVIQSDGTWSISRR